MGIFFVMNLRKKGSSFFFLSSFFLAVFVFYCFSLYVFVWNCFSAAQECLVWVFITFSTYWRVFFFFANYSFLVLQLFFEILFHIYFGEREERMKDLRLEWRNFKVFGFLLHAQHIPYYILYHTSCSFPVKLLDFRFMWVAFWSFIFTVAIFFLLSAINIANDWE